MALHQIHHKKTELKEFINLSADSIRHYSSLLKELIKDYPTWHPNDDARIVPIKFIIEDFQSYHILLNLLNEQFTNITIWDFQKYENTTKEAFLSDRLYFILGDLKSNLLISIFMQFEHFIRIVGHHFNLNNPSINALSKEVIDLAGIDVKYKNLVDLFTYLRNVIHFGGHHTKNSITVNYEGKDYEFKKGAPIDFLDDETLHYILQQVGLLMNDIIRAQIVSQESVIQHTFADIEFIYE